MGADVYWRRSQPVGGNDEDSGVPMMTKSSFINTERAIGEMWGKALKQSIGQREWELAIEKGCYHEGVPAITVIMDGGWSKRSHKYSYNFKSGIAINHDWHGDREASPRSVGVHNKYCHACVRLIPQKNHICYRNWAASSSEMETDIT